MIRRTQLIILNTTKVGERSLVLHTLSDEWGRRSFLTTVRKGSGMALCQPLSTRCRNILDFIKGIQRRIAFPCLKILLKYCH